MKENELSSPGIGSSGVSEPADLDEILEQLCAEIIELGVVHEPGKVLAAPTLDDIRILATRTLYNRIDKLFKDRCPFDVDTGKVIEIALTGGRIGIPPKTWEVFAYDLTGQLARYRGAARFKHTDEIRKWLPCLVCGANIQVSKGWALHNPVKCPAAKCRTVFKVRHWTQGARLSELVPLINPGE